MDRMSNTENSFFSLCLAECRDLRVRGSGDRSLPGTADAPPMGMPHMSRWHHIANTRLCRHSQRVTRVMVPLAYRSCWGGVSLCPVSELVAQRKKDRSLSQKTPFWREQKPQYSERTYFFGKPAVFLGSGRMIGRKSFLPQYDPQVTIHYWFFRQAMMKLQQEAQGQSKEIAGLWPKQLRIRSTISALLYPSSCGELWGKTQEGPTDQYRYLSLLSPAEFWDFWSLLLYTTLSAGDRWGTPVSKVENYLHSGVKRGLGKKYKLDFKGEKG